MQYECLRDFKYFDEREQRYPTDIEFAVRSGRIYIVQSRVLRQSPAAQIINSYDFYREGIYSPFKLIKRTAFSLNKKITKPILTGKPRTQRRSLPWANRSWRSRARPLIIDQNTMARFDGPLIFLTESNVPPRVIMEENVLPAISQRRVALPRMPRSSPSEKKNPASRMLTGSGVQRREIILGGMQLQGGRPHHP